MEQTTGNLFTATGAVSVRSKRTEDLEAKQVLLKACALLLDLGYESQALEVHIIARTHYPASFSRIGCNA